MTLTSERGEVVPLQPTDASALAEAVPLEPLAPHTRYTLLYKHPKLPGITPPPADITMHFITGDSLYAADITAPAPGIAHYATKHTTSCDIGGRASCISLPDQDFYIWRVQGETRTGLTRGSFFAVMDAPQSPAFECVELMRRAPNGKLGPASVICRDAGPSYDLDELGVRDEINPPNSPGVIGCDARGLLSDGTPVSELAAAAAQEDESGAGQEEPGEEDDEDEDVQTDEAAMNRAADNSSCAVRAGARDAAAPKAWLIALAAVWLGWRRREGAQKMPVSGQ